MDFEFDRIHSIDSIEWVAGRSRRIVDRVKLMAIVLVFRAHVNRPRRNASRQNVYLIFIAAKRPERIIEENHYYS